MITLKNLSLTGEIVGKEVQILSNINVQLPSTGLVVLKGDKSVDKTYLLKVLARVEEYTSGSMYIDGVDMGLLSSSEIENYRTHYATAVTDSNDLMDELTIGQNVYTGMAFGRIKPAKKVMDMLYESLRLTTSIDKKAKDATPEEKVFASIARLMVKSPRVFLIDNFEDIIDPSSMTKMWRILKEASEKHLVVIVTDSKAYIEKFADRVIVMKDGAIASDTGVGKIDMAKDSKQELLDKSILVRKHRFNTSSMWSIFRQIFVPLKGRVIGTLLGCMALFIAFAICSSMCVFNTHISIAKSSKEHNEAYIQFYKGNDDDRQLLNYDNTAGKESIIATLQKEGLSYFCAMHEVNWDTNINGGYVIPAIITNSQVLGVGDENKFGQELLSGRYTGSAAIANDEEAGTNIVISDYLAEVIIRQGISGGFAPGQNVEGGLRNIALYDALTDKYNSYSNNFYMNGIYYNIVGIYKTDFDQYVDKYLEPYKDTEKIFEYNLQNVYNVVHVNTNFYTINARRATAVTMPAKEVSVYALIMNEDNTPKYTPLYTEGEITIMNGASYKYYSDIAPLLSDSNFNQLTSTGTHIYVSADIFRDICDKAGANVTLSQIIQDYKNYGGMIKNPEFNNLKMGDSDTKCYIAGVIPSADITKTVVVGGKYVTSADMDTRSRFEYLFLEREVFTNAVVMPATMFNISEVEHTIGMMSEMGYNVSTLASGSIEEFGQIISDMRILLIGVSLVIVCGVVLLILSYIKKIVKSNIRTIAILRSLGCTKINVNFIISVFVLLGVLASIILAGLLSWVVTLAINAIMAGVYGYAMSIFSINILVLVILTVLLIGGVVIIEGNITDKYHAMSPATLLAISNTSNADEQSSEGGNTNNIDTKQKEETIDKTDENNK